MMEMPESLTPLVGLALAFLCLLLMVLVIWVGLACVRLWAQIKREQPKLIDILDDLARRAVQAATGKWIETDPERKKYAVKMVFTWLAAMGIRGVLIDMVEEAIEREVTARKESAAFILSGRR